MMRPMLTHVAFNCASVAESIAFYNDFCHMHVVHERVDGGVRVAWVSREREDPSFVLVLIERSGEQPDYPPAIDHLGFACDTRDEVDAVARQAEDAGVPVVIPPVQLPHPVGYFTIIADPDGNRIEFSHGQPINPKHL